LEFPIGQMIVFFNHSLFHYLRQLKLVFMPFTLSTILKSKYGL
jgi:hypothetical protein